MPGQDPSIENGTSDGENISIEVLRAEYERRLNNDTSFNQAIFAYSELAGFLPTAIFGASASVYNWVQTFHYFFGYSEGVRIAGDVLVWALRLAAFLDVSLTLFSEIPGMKDLILDHRKEETKAHQRWDGGTKAYKILSGLIFAILRLGIATGASAGIIGLLPYQQYLTTALMLAIALPAVYGQFTGYVMGYAEHLGAAADRLYNFSPSAFGQALKNGGLGKSSWWCFKNLCSLANRSFGFAGLAQQAAQAIPEIQDSNAAVQTVRGLGGLGGGALNIAAVNVKDYNKTFFPPQEQDGGQAAASSVQKKLSPAWKGVAALVCAGSFLLRALMNPGLFLGTPDADNFSTSDVIWTFMLTLFGVIATIPYVAYEYSLMEKGLGEAPSVRLTNGADAGSIQSPTIWQKCKTFFCCHERADYQALPGSSSGCCPSFGGVDDSTA